MPSAFYSRILLRAIDIAGSPAALCLYLRIPHRQLERWLAGEERPSDAVFLKLVDLLTERDVESMSPASRSALTRP